MLAAPFPAVATAVNRHYGASDDAGASITHPGCGDAWVDPHVVAWTGGRAGAQGLMALPSMGRRFRWIFVAGLLALLIVVPAKPAAAGVNTWTSARSSFKLALHAVRHDVPERGLPFDRRRDGLAPAHPAHQGPHGERLPQPLLG